jgi:antibiotic biosynthesis monooxygenase (ABM) superfamily enzyme
MAIVVFIAVYAMSSLTRSILNPFIGQWPILSNTIIYTAILVISLTYESIAATLVISKEVPTGLSSGLEL